MCKVNSSIDLLIEKRDVRTGFGLGKRDVGCANFFALFISLIFGLEEYSSIDLTLEPCNLRDLF